MKAKKRVAKKKAAKRVVKSTVVATPGPASKTKFSYEHVQALAAGSKDKRLTRAFAEWIKPALPPPGVGPGGDNTMAMDSLVNCGPGLTSAVAWAGALSNSAWAQGLVFPGYPYLSELAQRAEYRRMASVMATHATRKWITIKSASDEDKTAKIMQLTTAMERFNVKELFGKVSAHDAFFGRGHLYVDLGTQTAAELKTSIGDGSSKLSLNKIEKGSLKGFKVVEPIWCYPTSYDSNDPLSPNWYEPERWFVMAKEVHRTRLLKFVSREVPDIIKPAYSFGGLALSQMAQPVIDNWLRTRQSVSDLIHSFSVSGIKTDLSALLGADGNQLAQRTELFNVTRDNKGLMVLQNGPAGQDEEFFNISTPLSTLDNLQAQAQEHQCAVAGYPVIILLGLTPHGLNASSEGEIKVFNGAVNAYQEAFFSPHLKSIIDIIQINEFGELDPDITFEWNSLEDLNDVERANVEKVKADTDSVLITAGVLDPSEARARIAADPDADYAGIDVDQLPEPTDPEGLEEEMGGLGLPPGEERLGERRDPATVARVRPDRSDRADRGGRREAA